MPKNVAIALAVLLLCLSETLNRVRAADPVESAAPLATDTPSQTRLGNTFIAPAGWTVSVRGKATVLTAPEKDSWIALVDLAETEATDADAAVALGWAAYKPEFKAPLKVATDRPDKDGWSRQRVYEYQTSPNERRDVAAVVRFAGGVWTVEILDFSEAVEG